MSKLAIVLHSGGLDSTTALVIALEEGYTVLPLHIQYKQRHAVELDAAENVLAWLEEQEVYKDRILPATTVVMHGLGVTSALTGAVDVPKDRDGTETDIPVTYVPARNSLMLGIAMGFAESLDAQAIFAGYNAVDYSGYPDCRPEFVAAMQAALNLGTKRGVEGRPVKIEAPVIDWDKARIAEYAARHFPLELTWSCYDPQPSKIRDELVPCGLCDSCKIRNAALKRIGWPASHHVTTL